MTNCNQVPAPVAVQLNPEVTTTGAQDYTRAWRTCSQILSSLQTSLFNLQTCVNTITGTGTPATSVTAVGPSSVVGTSTNYARQDHVHAGVSDVGGATGSIIVGTGLTLTGNTLSTSGGGSAQPVPVLVISPGQSAISFAAPLALQEFNNLTIYRSFPDMTNATQAQLTLMLPPTIPPPGFAPLVAVQYFDTASSTWIYLDGAGGPNVTYNSTGMQVSSLVTLVTNARAQVQLRVVTSGGNGITSLGYGELVVSAR